MHSRAEAIYHGAYNVLTPLAPFPQPPTYSSTAQVVQRHHTETFKLHLEQQQEPNNQT